ncbi:MAG TPA: hypothetical protein DD734_04545 [Firmicutes bacterium]|nr:hypothetical protein [Bacillota bacterium]
MDKARQILDEQATDLAKQRLLSLPLKMEMQKRAIRQLREVYNEKEQTRALWEAEIMSEVVSASNPDTGKPAFSNETARNTEKLRRMAASEDYQKVARCAKDAELAVGTAQDELERLQDEFRAAQYVAEIVASEIALYAKTVPVELIRPMFGETVELNATNLSSGKPALKQAQAY